MANAPSCIVVDSYEGERGGTAGDARRLPVGAIRVRLPSGLRVTRSYDPRRRSRKSSLRVTRGHWVGDILRHLLSTEEPHMKRFAAVAASAVVVAIGLVAAVPSRAPLFAAPAHDWTKPGPDPEHARLTAMAGTWDVELTFWFKPGGPGMPTNGTSTIRPLFDGLFIEEKIEGLLNGTPFTTLAWTGFNTSTHEYEATRIASTNTARIAESGTWDERARQFELKASYRLGGDTWTQRTVIQPISADTMVATSYLSFGTVPEWKAVEIRYKRRAK
jgi:uncharacterized protein DUF1579